MQGDRTSGGVARMVGNAVLFMEPDLRSKIINRAFKQMWGISDELARECELRRTAVARARRGEAAPRCREHGMRFLPTWGVLSRAEVDRMLEG
jgi:hypothetical protein